MGNYRQHVGFASTLGVLYAAAMYVFAGVHWLYGSVACLLAILGGLLPDVDSESGAEMRTFTGILGVLAAASVWKGLDALQSELPFEIHLWSMVLAYLVVRHGLRLVVGRLTVHRGMSHSLPTGLVWGGLTYLYYPTMNHSVRVVMAAAVGLGFLSHLVLDEACSVDLKGARIRRTFGSALKFWAASPWSTVLVYVLLAIVSRRVIAAWPEVAAGPAWHVPAPNVGPILDQARAALETVRR